MQDVRFFHPNRREEMYISLAYFFQRPDFLLFLNEERDAQDIRKHTYQKIMNMLGIPPRVKSRMPAYGENMYLDNLNIALAEKYLPEGPPDPKAEREIKNVSHAIKKLLVQRIANEGSVGTEKKEDIINHLEYSLQQASALWGDMREKISLSIFEESALKLPQKITGFFDTYVSRLKEAHHFEPKEKIFNDFLTQYYNHIKSLLKNKEMDINEKNLKMDLLTAPMRIAGNAFEMSQKKLNDFEKDDTDFFLMFSGFFGIPEENVQYKKGMKGKKICKKEIETTVSTRGKEDVRIVLKMLKKIDFTSEKIVKDGVGIRIEVEEKDINTVVESLIYHIQQNLSKSKQKFSIINAEYSNLEFSDNIKQMLEGVGMKDDYKETFTDLRLTGEFYPKRSNKRKKEKISPWEIQIVVKGNENEKGVRHHGAYSRAEMLPSFMRLLEHGIPEALVSQTVISACYYAETEKDPNKNIKNKNNGERIAFRKKMIEKQFLRQNFFYSKERKAFFVSEKKEQFIPKYSLPPDITDAQISGFQQATIDDIFQKSGVEFPEFVIGEEFTEDSISW